MAPTGSAARASAGRHHLRIARPVSDMARAEAMYRHGLGLQVLARFVDHDGFDGVMLGAAGAGHHLEFTRSRVHPLRPTPTAEDLIVFYVPANPDWLAWCARMLAAGFREVDPVNPYWARRGRTFADFDGYRVVLQREEWPDSQRVVDAAGGSPAREPEARP